MRQFSRRCFLLQSAVATVAAGSRGTVAGIRGQPPVARMADVRAFGATGNGKSDDGPAIRSAIESLGAVATGSRASAAGGGGIVALYPGDYSLAAPLAIPPGVILYGAGPDSTTLSSQPQFPGTGRQALVQIQSSAGPFQPTGLCHLTVRPGPSRPDGAIGVECSAAAGVAIEDISIIGGSAGLVIHGGSGPVRWRNITLRDGQVGLDAQNASAVSISGLRLVGQAITGARLTLCSAITFEGLDTGGQADALEMTDSQVCIGQGDLAASIVPAVRLGGGRFDATQMFQLLPGQAGGPAGAPGLTAGSGFIASGVNATGQKVGAWNIGGQALGQWFEDPVFAPSENTPFNSRLAFGWSVSDFSVLGHLDDGSDEGQVDNAPGPVIARAALLPAPTEIYTTRRTAQGSLAYRFRVAPGDYVVRLHLVGYTGDGRRPISVLLNDQVYWKEVDVTAEAGGPLRALAPRWLVTAEQQITIKLSSPDPGGHVSLAGVEISIAD